MTDERIWKPEMPRGRGFVRMRRQKAKESGCADVCQSKLGEKILLLETLRVERGWRRGPILPLSVLGGLFFS